MDAFAKKYPKIVLDFQTAPAGEQYNQKLNTLMSAGESPDIFFDGPPINLHAKNGYLMDLTDQPALQEVSDKFKAAYQYEGKTYVYAPDAWIGGVFYNKKLFEKAGVKVPETWDEFLEVCKKLKAAGIKPLAVSAAQGGLNNFVYWLHMIDVLTGNPRFDLEIDEGKHTYAEGYTGPITNWYNDLVKPGYITQEMVGINDDQRMNEFVTEKAAMTINGPWAINGIREKNPNLDFDSFPFVGRKAEEKWSIGAINVGIAISSKTKNKDAALAFLNFFSSDEGLQLYQKMTGNILGVKRDIPYQVDPIMEKNKQIAIDGTFSFPVVDWIYSAPITPILEKGLPDIILGGMKPEEVPQSMDDKWKALSKSSQ